ncbi:helix-turn-helix domain-containing protein [Lactobacillus gasseri]|jgi:transcriptional regulator with XRE-family HTH domain|uniref:helix-turn-helix domain-containing protein n=1 Tax=Lactobacillus gasseri TaxID=1596 RepID=UPI003B67FAB5
MNRIKELRLKNKLSQAELGEKLNLPKGTLSRYENGIREPKIETWQALADYFNVSIPYIKGEIFYNDLSDKEKKIFDIIYNNLANEHLNIYSEIKIISALLNGKKRLEKYGE